MTTECFGNWLKCPQEKIQKINDDCSIYYEIICLKKDDCYLKSKSGEINMTTDAEMLIKYPKIFSLGSPETKEILDEFEIIDRYLNDARFQKAIFHLKEQGESIEMSLMPKLFRYVGDDILSENILYISGEWKSINFKTFYNLIASRCVKMLQEYILKNTKSE